MLAKFRRTLAAERVTGISPKSISRNFGYKSGLLMDPDLSGTSAAGGLQTPY